MFSSRQTIGDLLGNREGLAHILETAVELFETCVRAPEIRVEEPQVRNEGLDLCHRLAVSTPTTWKEAEGIIHAKLPLVNFYRAARFGLDRKDT